MAIRKSSKLFKILVWFRNQPLSVALESYRNKTCHDSTIPTVKCKLSPHILNVLKTFPRNTAVHSPLNWGCNKNTSQSTQLFSPQKNVGVKYQTFT